MNKLWVRLSLGFSGMMLAAVFVVALTGYMVGRVDPRLDHSAGSARLAAELAAYYQAHQSWAGSELFFEGIQAVFYRLDEDEPTFFLADARRQVIYHTQADLIGRPLDGVTQVKLVPIEVDGQTVGYLGLGPGEARLSNRPGGFVMFLSRALAIVATAAAIGGIIFGVVMSRSLTAPLNNLAEAAQAIGARQLSRRVEEKGSDELRAVARSFNDMAAGLEQAEQLRRNLLADVAHELRTPLSILQGNLRAILDEVYPLEQVEMARLYEQTRFLSRLVNDLHELAQAEAGQLALNREDTDLVELMQLAMDGFRPATDEKGVSLVTSLPAGPVCRPVDPARLTQVLQNLLANALRHTPSGGQIAVRLEESADTTQLVVADSGDGIAAEHLPHIFDRFYRTDPARSRDRGGAGLGLAIARAIVEAHGGRIEVTSPGVPGQGSAFTVRLFFS